MQASRTVTEWPRALGVLVFVALALAACQGSGESTRSGAGDASTEEVIGQSAPPASDTAAEPGEELAVSDTVSPSGEGPVEEFGRMIVKTADLGVQVEDVEGSAAMAQKIAAQAGGSVLNSQVDRDENRVSASLMLSVPSTRFESTLDELRALGQKITTDDVAGEDVTEEFVDLESRERNLLAAEQSLLKLYDEAASVSDTLAIQRELTVVRGEIEQVQGRIQYLEQRSDFSQISLSIQPVAGPPASRSGWDPAAIVARAWNASLSVLQVFATALISAVIFGWWLAPVFGAGYLWWRRRNRNATPQATNSP